LQLRWRQALAQRDFHFELPCLEPFRKMGTTMADEGFKHILSASQSNKAFF